MITQDDIKRLRELMAKATPGPWHTEESRASSWRTIHAAGEGHNATGKACDAALIVALVNAAPKLLEAAAFGFERDTAYADAAKILKERDDLRAKLDAVSGELELSRSLATLEKHRAERAEAEVAALKADRDNWMRQCKDADGCLHIIRQEIGKRTPGMLHNIGLIDDVIDLLNERDAALARAGLMEEALSDLMRSMYKVGELLICPTQAFDDANKTLATPANGGEANG